MRNLKQVILSCDSGISKEAAGMADVLAKIYMPVALAGGLAAIGRELIVPLGDKIMGLSDQAAVLNRLKTVYQPEKHKILEEVYGVIKHTAPHMSRNYLVAKTLVDHQMTVMEQLSGNNPAGAMLNIPTVEQGAKIEKDVMTSGQSRAGSIESAAANSMMGIGLQQAGFIPTRNGGYADFDPDKTPPMRKHSSEKVDEYIEFLEGLI